MAWHGMAWHGMAEVGDDDDVVSNELLLKLCDDFINQV